MLNHRHLVTFLVVLPSVVAFSTIISNKVSNNRHAISTTLRASLKPEMERRTLLGQVLQFTSAAGVVVSAGTLLEEAVSPAWAASFTAGGTLVDRDVGVQVGNSEASPSRRQDNSNVIFDKDHYFKFGVAAPWIAPGETDFPKTMPFTPSQQRYDALKKYGSRVRSGAAFLVGLEESIGKGSADMASVIPDPASTDTGANYALRPMGLLANNFLASENTGTTNELFLARWYINEIYLQLLDARNSDSPKEAAVAYKNAKKAMNSYLGMMNRVINTKVGDPFELLPV